MDAHGMLWMIFLAGNGVFWMETKQIIIVLCKLLYNFVNVSKNRIFGDGKGQILLESYSIMR